MYYVVPKQKILDLFCLNPINVCVKSLGIMKSILSSVVPCVNIDAWVLQQCHNGFKETELSCQHEGCHTVIRGTIDVEVLTAKKKCDDLRAPVQMLGNGIVQNAD